MTTDQKIKASNFLLQRDGQLSGEKCYLPKIFMVGNEICLTLFSALRYQRNWYCFMKEKLDIEKFTILDAYQFMHNKDLPLYMDRKVNWNYKFLGELAEGEECEKLYRWQIEKYKENPIINYFTSF